MFAGAQIYNYLLLHRYSTILIIATKSLLLLSNADERLNLMYRSLKAFNVLPAYGFAIKILQNDSLTAGTEL
jgi:hypothetical protein